MSEGFIVDPKSLSFSKIRDDLVEFLDSRPDAAKWTGFFDSLTGQTVIELVAGLGAYTQYHNIVGRREAYLAHARNKSSSIGISQSLGYSVFRGVPEYLRLTVTPTVTQTLERFSVVGQLKDQDLVILETTPLNLGISVELVVAIGVLAFEELAVEDTSLNVFRFSSPDTSEDFRILLNGTEVDVSNRIIDLEDDKFAALSNVFGSVDVMYLNQDTAPIQYNPGDILRLEQVALKEITYSQDQVTFFYGDTETILVEKAYEDPETVDEIRINAPLFHETQSLIRGRQDFLKVFRFLDTSFVSTNQRDVSTAEIELVYLKDDYIALTEAEKTSYVEDVFKNIIMGVPPPNIADPVRAFLTINVDLTLSDTTGDYITDIDAIMATRENKLEQSIDLKQIEADIEALEYVQIARVKLGSSPWETVSKYLKSQHVTPTTPNGFIYEMNSILYYSNDEEPVWPTTVGSQVIDNGILWEAEYIDLTSTSVSTWSASTSYMKEVNWVVPTVPNGRQYKVAGYVNRSFGNNEIQKIEFDLVPDAGTWRVYYESEKTGNLAFDASAVDLQDALNGLDGLSTVEVTGDYTTGFVITFAGADGNMVQPELEIADTGTDEVQLVSFSDTPNFGSFGLEHEGQTTSSLAYDATETDVKNALEVLPSIDSVDVVGDFGNGFSITFQGANEKKPVSLIVPALLSTEGGDEEQLIAFASVPTTGTWRIHYNDEYTGNLPFDANATTVQSELNGLPSLSGIVVTGNYSSGFSITFGGDSGKQDQPLLDIDFAGQNEIQKIQFSLAPDFGTWRLEYDNGATIEETANMPFNAAPVDIKDALEALPSFTSGDVDVSGDYISGFLVEFIGNAEKLPHEMLAITGLGQDEVQDIEFKNPSLVITEPNAGTFTLIFDGQETSAISYSATTEDVEDALTDLSNIDGVTVTGDFGTKFQVTFDGDLVRRSDVPMLTVGTNSLSFDQDTAVQKTQLVSNGFYSFTSSSFQVGQTFGTGTSTKIEDITVYIDKIGSPVAEFIMDIYTTAVGGEPETFVGSSSNTITSQSKPNSSEWEFLFDSLEVSAATTYAFVLRTTIASVYGGVDYIRVGASIGVAPNPDAPDGEQWSWNGFAWTQVSENDLYYKMNLTYPTSEAISLFFAESQAYILPANNLTRLDNGLVISLTREQEGLIPGNSLGGPAIYVTETIQGYGPVSNLEKDSVPVDITTSVTTEGEVPANSLENTGGGVVVTVTTLVDAVDSEPSWPTEAGETLVEGDILWLSIREQGSPANWQPGTVYNVGDFISPITPVEDSESYQLMYQCIGFVGTSDTSEPSFPGVLNETVVDGNILWKTRLAGENPSTLDFDEYYILDQVIST